MRIRIAVLLVFSALLVGCQDEPQSSRDTGAPTDTAPDDTEAPADSAADADGAEDVGDTSGDASDSGAMDGGGDSGDRRDGGDTGDPTDGGPQDSGPEDSGPDDSGPSETGDVSATFECGGMTCERGRKYCQKQYPGVRPPDGGTLDPSYNCVDYGECGPDPDCDCLEQKDAVGGASAECTRKGPGAYLVEQYLP